MASRRLRGAGTQLLTPRDTPRKPTDDMSIEEMERALKSRPLKNPGEGPYSARSLQEINKHLIQQRQEKKAMERNSSREDFHRTLSQTNEDEERDRAESLNKRMERMQMSKSYKENIGEKEKAKAHAYTARVQTGPNPVFFPFVGGESLEEKRQEKAAEAREEMREQMRRQREERPPRTDSLLASAKAGNSLAYPVGPGAEEVAAADSVGPHMQKYPLFLSRAKPTAPHRSGVSDSNMQKALAEKVQQTKKDLQATEQRRRNQNQEVEDSLFVLDALRHDKESAKAAERQRNAEYLKAQMEESKQKKQRERMKDHEASMGYWGPEEKDPQDPRVYVELCKTQIQQMEVDQQRRQQSRKLRIDEEKKLINNSIEEMINDRREDYQKTVQQKSSLTSTWNNQKEIIVAKKQLEVP